jgi:hypothetical protein
MDNIEANPILVPIAQVFSYVNKYANLAWDTMAEDETLQLFISNFETFLKECQEFFQNAKDAVAEFLLQGKTNLVAFAAKLQTDGAEFFANAYDVFWQTLPMIGQKLADFAEQLQKLGQCNDEFMSVFQGAIDGVDTGCKMMQNAASLINARDIVDNGVQLVTNGLEFIEICANNLVYIKDLFVKLADIYNITDLNFWVQPDAGKVETNPKLSQALVLKQ